MVTASTRKPKTRFVRDSGSESSETSGPVPPKRFRNKKRQLAAKPEPPAPARQRTLMVDFASRVSSMCRIRDCGVAEFHKWDPEASNKMVAWSLVANFMTKNLMLRETSALACASSCTLDGVYKSREEQRCVVIGTEAPCGLAHARAENLRYQASFAGKSRAPTREYSLVVYANGEQPTYLASIRRELELGWLTRDLLKTLVIVGPYHKNQTPSTPIGSALANELSKWGVGVRQLVLQNVFPDPTFFPAFSATFCPKLGSITFKDIKQTGFPDSPAAIEGSAALKRFCNTKAFWLSKIEFHSCADVTALVAAVFGSLAENIQLSVHSNELIVDTTLQLGSQRQLQLVFDDCKDSHMMPRMWRKLNSFSVQNIDTESEAVSDWISSFFKFSGASAALTKISLVNCSADVFRKCIEDRENGLQESEKKRAEKVDLEEVHTK